jgi:nitroreductase
MFKVFVGDGIQTLANWQGETYTQIAGESFSQDKCDKLQSRPLLASAIIGICMKRDIEERDPIQEELASVAIAVQNIMLLAAAHGIGSYWGTGGLTYSQEIKQFLSLGESELFMGFLYLGYPEGEWPKKTRRRPQEYFTEWIES